MAVLAVPLLPVAASFTLGIVLDRLLQAPLVIPGLIGLGLTLTWLLDGRLRTSTGTMALLWALCGVAGAWWHHVRHWPARDDVGHLAGEEPKFVRVRGVVRDLHHQPATGDVLHSRPEQARSTLVLRATAIDRGEGFQSCGGLVIVWVGQRLTAAHVGDEVELLGELRALAKPGNPGERDYRAALEDLEIRAGMRVKTTGGVRLVQEASPWRIGVWVDRLRRAARLAIESDMSHDVQPAATALLLGDMSAMPPADVQRYMRTGVIHVLAISGQHLMILCAALAVAGRLIGLRRRRTVVAMMILVVGYTLLTGARPATLRATAIVCMMAYGWLLRRQVQPVNSLAAAWILVAVINPSDLFEFGCQLSFLSVLVLYQVIGPWKAACDRLMLLNPLPAAWKWLIGQPLPLEADPLHALFLESQPAWQRLLRVFGGWGVWSLITSVCIWLALAPLLAWRGHLVSPSAALLGPIVIPLSTLALIAGFVFLLLAPLDAGVHRAAGSLTEFGLRGLDGVLGIADRVPGAYSYTPGPEFWWLVVWYALLLGAILVAGVTRWPGWRSVAALCVWACVGLIAAGPMRSAGDELRVAFLAVGHGGCAVLETPDGRVFLYDAGALSGPEVAGRQIAPYLWSRGIARIDEVFISHADLDHYNGLPELVDMFHVGQVSCTPSFMKSDEPGVRLVLAKLAAARVPVRIVRAGMMLDVGGVSAEVLHPPEDGPTGVENARSLVLLLRYHGQSLLLTGDLEEPGLSQVRWPNGRYDVMLAPHHGSALSNTEGLAKKLRPRLVIASAARERRMKVNPYAPLGAVVWETWQEGAVTVRMTAATIEAETFRTGRKWTSP
jgi:competence protein ComEC